MIKILRFWPIPAVVWIASLAAAYYLGSNSAHRRAAPEGDPAFGKNTGANSMLGGAGSSLVSSGNGGKVAGKGDSGALADVDVKALIGEIRAQFRTGPGMRHNPSGMIKTLAPLADLSESQIREALEEVEELREGVFRTGAVQSTPR